MGEHVSDEILVTVAGAGRASAEALASMAAELLSARTRIAGLERMHMERTRYRQDEIDRLDAAEADAATWRAAHADAAEDRRLAEAVVEATRVSWRGEGGRISVRAADWDCLQARLKAYDEAEDDRGER